MKLRFVCIQSILPLYRTDRVCLLATVVVLVGVRMLLSILPFRVVYRLTGLRLVPIPHRTVDRQRVVKHLRQSLKTTSRHLPSLGNCLVRALATRCLLSQVHVPSSLRLGVRMSEAGGLEAHAWLVSGDRAVVGDDVDLDRYSALPSLESVLT